MLSYIKRFAAKHHKPLAARLAKAVFRHFTKSHNTNNARKVRAVFDVLFLSWLFNKTGELSKLLAEAPWSFGEDVVNDTLTGLGGIFETRKEAVPGLISKLFRDALRKDIAGLVKAKNTETVCTAVVFKYPYKCTC